MPITDHQRALRAKHLGSSDAPRVLGVSPWGGADDVYYEKVLPLEPDEPTAAMENGNRLEGPLLDWAAEQLGVTIRRNQFRVGDDDVLAANLDALIVGRSQALEAKYVGPDSLEQWGEPGTDQVPVYVAAQVQHQMYVADLSVVWIPCFMARFRPAWEMYRVDRDQAIIDQIVEAELAFWNEHVLPKLPPDPSALPSIELLKRLKREPGSIIDLGPEVLDLVAWRDRVAADLKQARAADEEAKSTIIAELGEAEAGRLPDGRLITYMQQSRREYVCKASTYRVLKIKGGDK